MSAKSLDLETILLAAPVNPHRIPGDQNPARVNFLEKAGRVVVSHAELASKTKHTEMLRFSAFSTNYFFAFLIAERQTTLCFSSFTQHSRSYKRSSPIGNPIVPQNVRAYS